MRCNHPITVEDPKTGYPLSVRCRQCTGCRIRRQQEWLTRNLMEAQDHDEMTFLTLTYRPEERPDTLIYADFQRFLKRLRKTTPKTIRFFACGEYGEKSGHPHFHAIMYGWTPPQHELDRPNETSSHWHTGLWPHGFAHTGQVTPASIRYTTRYCLKKTGSEDEAIMRVSLRPALGDNGFYALGKELWNQYPGGRFPHDLTALRIGNRCFPLAPASRNAMARAWEDLGGEVRQRSSLVSVLDHVIELREMEALPGFRAWLERTAEEKDREVRSKFAQAKTRDKI